MPEFIFLKGSIIYFLSRLGEETVLWSSNNLEGMQDSVAHVLPSFRWGARPKGDPKVTEGVSTEQAQCLSTLTHPGTPRKAQAQGWAAPVHSLESWRPWARLPAWPSDTTREVVCTHVCMCVYCANVHVCTRVLFCFCALPCAHVCLYVCTCGLMCLRAYLRFLPVPCHDTGQE